MCMGILTTSMSVHCVCWGGVLMEERGTDVKDSCGQPCGG